MNITAGPTLTVLLAEDDENDVLLIRRAFQRIRQLSQLLVVGGGEEVIEFLCGSGSLPRFPTPDVLVLDQRMGGVSGIDVLFWLRTEPRWKKLPVLLWSNALSDSELEVVAGLKAASALKTSHFSDLPLALARGLRSAVALAHGSSFVAPFGPPGAFPGRAALRKQEG